MVALLRESKAGKYRGLPLQKISQTKTEPCRNDVFVVCVWKMGYRKIYRLRVITHHPATF